MDMDMRLFAGANTCRGFMGYYDQLQHRAHKALYLKGGPGVGKSTFIREAAEKCLKKGHTVHLYACSGDPESLDALWDDNDRLFIADGTSPHVMDPIHPGAADGILNLGTALNEKWLSQQQSAIFSLQQDIVGRYKQAYRYLAAAEQVIKDAFSVYADATDPSHLQALQKELSVQLCPGPEGECTDVFIQAITCKGLIQHLGWLRADQIICLDLPWGFEAHRILAPLQTQACLHHWAHTVYHDPLCPDRIAHLRIGRTLITTAVMQEATRYEITLDKGHIANHLNRLSFDRAAYDLMMHQAFDALHEAKAQHDTLERYYIDAMDYETLTQLKQKALDAL